VNEGLKYITVLRQSLPLI